MSETNQQTESLLDKMKRKAEETKAANPETQVAKPTPDLKPIADEVKNNPAIEVVQADVDAPVKPTPIIDVGAPVEQELTYHVYYNTVASCKMLTDSGRVIAFVGGKYITDQEEEIEYLNREIALGSIYLSQVPGKEVMTATELDPMAMLRKQHFEEFQAEQAEAARKIAAGEPLSQSESEAQVLTPGSTAHTAQLAAGSGQ